MSILLIVLGVLGFAAGVAMIAFGIPVKEFSLGNTLILAGTVAASGGMIVFALGLALGQLRQIADAVMSRSALPNQVPDLPPVLKQMRRPPARAAASATAAIGAAVAAELALDRPAPPRDEPDVAAPPVEPPLFPQLLREEERVPAELDPVRHPETLPAENDTGERIAPREDERPLPFPYFGSPPFAGGDDQRQHQPPSQQDSVERKDATFDQAWPSGTSWSSAPDRPEEDTSLNDAGPQSEPLKPDLLDAFATPPVTPEPPRAAILKSGVVDGMGYTLYVDGAIEAELPQGTVRFASIQDLRDHLEKNSGEQDPSSQA